MPSCPSCRRPVAIARATCVYCGAPLPAAAIEEAQSAARAAMQAAAQAAPEAEALPRTLVVIDLERVQAESLVRTIGVSRYEAALLARRRGLHLHRLLAPAQAASEAARLAAADVVVWLVPESEARIRPLRAVGGALTPAGLLLRTEEGSLQVAAGELLLLVSGPITRERRASAARPKVATATLEQSWCVHLHRRADPHPLEIDASSFEPGFAAAGSTQLELRAWLEVIGQGVLRDDAFRLLAPALAPAEAPTRGALAAVESLRPGGRNPAAVTAESPLRPPAWATDERVVLDNLAQFRFYSGWRSAVERHRARAKPPVTAPGSD